MKKRSYNEDTLQIWCANYLRMYYGHLVFNHSPNEGERKNGAKLKSMGMQPGWPDMDVFDEANSIHVEFKTPTGRQSPEQKAMQERLERIGRKYYVCRTREQFMDICRENFTPSSESDEEILKRMINE